MIYEFENVIVPGETKSPALGNRVFVKLEHIVAVEVFRRRAKNYDYETIALLLKDTNSFKTRNESYVTLLSSTTVHSNKSLIIDVKSKRDVDVFVKAWKKYEKEKK